MRWRDRSDEGHDREMAATLAALDAALAGEPTEPEHAELCEIALLVAAERPRPEAGELAGLDRAVETRFAQRRPSADGRRRVADRSRGGVGSAWSRRRPAAWGGAAAALAAGALIAVVVGLPGGGGGASEATSSTAALSSAGASSPRAPSAPAFGQLAPPSAGSDALPHVAPGRQVVEGAQLALAAPAARIETVAQEVFDVVAAENGIVENSTVNSGGAADAYATFSLSIPSANLSQALRLLSTLRGSQVLSRTDTSSDITGTVGATGRRLAEDRALRSSLLRQLAAASTTAQAASLQSQLQADDRRIAADSAKLAGLHRDVANSRVSVTIQAAGTPAPRPVHHSGGLTIGRALHDAGRVLVVAAAVALIALAVLVPLGLVGAVGAWIWATVRRRRREAALDLL